MEQQTTAQVIKTLMDGWDTIMAAAKRQFPDATADELQVIATGAMNQSLGIATRPA